TVRQLLAGETVAASSASAATRSNVGVIVAAVRDGIALLLAVLALQLTAEAQAEAFMAAGAADLVATLILIHRSLKGRPARAGGTTPLASGGLSRLAMRSAGRNVGRSVATIALVASATFLIVAVSSFRLAPSDEGTAGFAILGETSQPIF